MLFPSEAFHKENKAVVLQTLTKDALEKLNEEAATLAEPAINDDAKKKYLI